MASELRVTTIANNAGTESVGSTYVINGSAKAWVFYNGSQAIQDSFSVSSVTDRATGRHTINISSAMANATYSVAGQGSWRDSATDGNTVTLGFERQNTVAITTTACPVQTTYYGTYGNLGDAPATTADIHGDLA